MTDNKIIIFDTTLRDGEQSPGASMNISEKLEVAKMLEKLGVDVIEAGFPIASQGDFEAVREIAKATKKAKIAGLARCLPKDIERAAEALSHAGDRARIHVFLATSAIHMEFKLGKAKEEIIKQAVIGVKLAKSLIDDIEFSAEDASRTEPKFLVEIVEAVIEAGATTINIPDTVGYGYPEDYASVTKNLLDNVKNIDKAVISVHCHNDLGLATANSLAAVRAGAKQVECTINGIGERAGNAALEEVVMTMRVRKDLFKDKTTNINTEHLYAASRLLQTITGLPLQKGKAIVGDNAFAHESGIHQHGMMKNRETYEIMTPESVGVPSTVMVLGKHSGRAALADRLKTLGFEVSKEQLNETFETFKDLADRKKEIFDADIMAIANQITTGQKAETWELEYLDISSGTNKISTATVTLTKNEEEITDSSTGDGPIDAIVKTINKITDNSCQVKDYSVRSVTSGKDAQGEVNMLVENGDSTVGGKGLSTDIIEASCLSYLDAINRISLTTTKETK